MKKQNSSLSLHNFLNENIPNFVNLREKLKNEVIKVNIGVKRHCGDRNLKTKTAVLSEFNNKLTNRHAKLHKIKTSTCLLKVFQGL